jgi:hypothetical protein
MSQKHVTHHHAEVKKIGVHFKVKSGPQRTAKTLKTPATPISARSERQRVHTSPKTPTDFKF